MISVARFWTVCRISGPVEKMPRTGPAPFSCASTDLAVAVSCAPGPPTISRSVRWAWNWP